MQLDFRMAMIVAFAAMLLSGLQPAEAAALPDGRSYELVTPADTGSVAPSTLAVGEKEGVDCFNSNFVRPDGSGVAFGAPRGSLPGLESTGARNLYEARRTSEGWVSESLNPRGTETTLPWAGLCLSPDLEFSTLESGEAPEDLGSFPIEGKRTSYLRGPGNSFTAVGNGSVGTDPEADIRWISVGARHVILTADSRLEAGAPDEPGNEANYESGDNPPVAGIYDRTSSGVSLVSVLPGDIAPDPAVESIHFQGVSEDGEAVVFEDIEGDATPSPDDNLYVRRGDTTQPITSGPMGVPRFGGIATDGGSVVYLESEAPQAPTPSGQLWGTLSRFDVATGATQTIAPQGEAALVNISADGSRVYFASFHDLTGSERNSRGASAKGGSPNLYLWDARTEATTFVATVALPDVDPSLLSSGNPEFVFGLTRWQLAMGPAAIGDDTWAGATSRTTPDGSVLVFQSRGEITGFDADGNAEIYRFDASDGKIDCVSCPPPGVPVGQSAALELTSTLSKAVGKGEGPSVIGPIIKITNVTDDGSEVFFNSKDALVPADTNGNWDVYRWKAGEVALISPGSGPPSVLYGTTRSGRDVFFTTEGRLVPADRSSVLSIYDARIGGGFAEPPASLTPCEGDSCQGPPAPQPVLEPPSSALTPAAVKKPHKPKPHRKRAKTGHRRHHGSAGR